MNAGDMFVPIFVHKVVGAALSTASCGRQCRILDFDSSDFATLPEYKSRVWKSTNTM